MAIRRIGAYGGTFDPIHNGHIEIARAVVRNFHLDRLLIIPAHRPPHKNSRAISDAYHRYAMAVVATIEEPALQVSTIEMEAPERPYTFETIERLRDLFGPEHQLFFVMGADSFEEINTWREPGRIFASVNLIVAARPGHAIATDHLPSDLRSGIVEARGRAELPASTLEEESPCCKTYLTDFVNNEVSSTEIRRKVRDGQPVDELVPARVADYMKKYGMYRR